MNKEIKRFFITYFAVSFCFMLGYGFLGFVEFIGDVLLGTHFMENWHMQTGHFAQLLCGWFGVAWAIRDGQFIDHIKASHWSKKTNA